MIRWKRSIIQYSRTPMPRYSARFVLIVADSKVAPPWPRRTRRRSRGCPSRRRAFAAEAGPDGASARADVRFSGVAGIVCSEASYRRSINALGMVLGSTGDEMAQFGRSECRSLHCRRWRHDEDPIDQFVTQSPVEDARPAGSSNSRPGVIASRPDRAEPEPGAVGPVESFAGLPPRKDPIRRFARSFPVLAREPVVGPDHLRSQPRTAGPERTGSAQTPVLGSISQPSASTSNRRRLSHVRARRGRPVGGTSKASPGDPRPEVGDDQDDPRHPRI